MVLELNLTKNTNDSLQGTFGKYYPRVEYKGTIGTLELAKHMLPTPPRSRRVRSTVC